MSLVIDASVALKWVLDEPGSIQAESLLDQSLIAPDLWLIEAANALWKRVQRSELTKAEALERLEVLRRAPVTSFSSQPILAKALDLAHQLNHPIYDCLYLALAIQEDSQVITADRRFYTVGQQHNISHNRLRLLES